MQEVQKRDTEGVVEQAGLLQSSALPIFIIFMETIKSPQVKKKKKKSSTDERSLFIPS